jgi:hypothetical protein
MAGNLTRFLISRVALELQSAQSNASAISEALLVGPLDIHALILFDPNSTTIARPTIYDDETVSFIAGQLTPQANRQIFKFHPMRVRINGTMGLVRPLGAADAGEVQYTILYSRP